MRKEIKGFAVTAGIFLILYALPYLFFGPLGFFSGVKQVTLEDFSILIYSLLFPLAGLFLILRKPKIAAVLVVLASAAVAASVFSTIPNLLREVYVEHGDHETFVPRFYVLVPILEFTVPLLLAVALFLRGRGALILALLAAAAEVAYTVLTFNMMSYITGHPSPFNIIMPFNFIMTAIFAGFYLLSLGRKQAGEGEEETE